MPLKQIRLFALQSTRNFGEGVSGELGTPLSAHEEREFEDGEHKSRPLVNVRGTDVYVVHSLYSDIQESVNDKLCRLLFFIGALKDAAAERVTAIIPYLAYARKDRKTKSRDPVTTRYIASLLEAVGTDRVVTMDVHNLAAFQNAFRCATDHLEAKALFVDYFATRLREEEIVVASPDVGGIKRVEEFARTLSKALDNSVSIAFMQKRRSEGFVTGGALAGEVKNRTVIILDDLISSGTTIARAVNACQHLGATKIYAAASHGLFVGDASKVLANPALEKTVITNTIPPFRVEASINNHKLVVLDTAPLFAEAIRRIHNGGSLVELMEPAH